MTLLITPIIIALWLSVLALGLYCLFNGRKKIGIAVLAIDILLAVGFAIFMSYSQT